jgi:hypothetical protein
MNIIVPHPAFLLDSGEDRPNKYVKYMIGYIVLSALEKE